MKLMYVLPAEAFGGAERQGVLHIRRLGDFGVELEAVVGPGQPVRRALQSYSFSDYHYCEDFPADTHSQMGLLGNLRYASHYIRSFFRSSEELVRIGREAGTEAIFAGRSFGWAVAAHAAHSLGIPYIVRAGSRPTRMGQLPAIRAMCARYGRPAALLSNCKAVEDCLADSFRCPTGIVPNGVDTSRFDPAATKAEVRVSLGLGDRLVVGLAARPSPEKGIELLAEVVKLCSRAIPKVLFVVAGEFGWRSHYEDMVEQQGLSDNLRFLGHIDSMPEFFASCDVVILTSPQRSIEGSPNALLEAMSMARPIVASEVGGIPEIIRDGVEGYLVPPEDANSFSDRIIELLNNETRRRAMASAGRARIIERFSEEAAMLVLAAHLERFVGSARSEGAQGERDHRSQGRSER